MSADGTELSDGFKILAALGPAFTAGATIIIGIAVAIISYRQWRTAHERLVLDLFDRRMKCYGAIVKAAQLMLSNHASDGETLLAFWNARGEAAFLFGDDVMICLKRFESTVHQLAATEITIPLSGIDELPKLVQTKEDNVVQVLKFLDDFSSICGRYMRMTQSVRR